MELPLFAALQRTPRVALTLSFVLFSLTIVPALYSLLANPISPLLVSSSETDGPFPSDHMHLSPLNSPSVRTISPVNSPLHAPYHTRHQKSSSGKIPSPNISPIPVPPDHTLSRHQHSSSNQSPSPVNGSIPAPLNSSSVTTSKSRTQIRDNEQRCDLFNGEWIPNDESPYYNMTCWAIQEHQNCMQFGRPDTGFMRWRWKPDSCDLPIFDPNEFLEMVRGKSMVFVVKTTKPDPTDPKSNFFSLYLDEYDNKWTSQINQLDFLIISSGHWFYRPLIFYENEKLSGCQYCSLPNTTELPLHYGYTKALRTSLRGILENFTGLAIRFLLK
uniref:Uncharacterized protein n=1 Tax=Brassica campestris TaxID=3711 RepID=M4CWR9_BRACM